MQMSGAQLIAALLERQGIKTVAGIPGGSILPLYDVLNKSSIEHILVRHEQAAGFIAQGIARSTGKTAVCLATSGPGAMNLTTAIADARADSVPIIAITGQVNSNLIGTDAFQEVDTFGLSFPIAKHSVMVKSAKDLLSIIPHAFALAASGRPGPVLIDVPRDIQTQIVEFDAFPEPGAASPGAERYKTDGAEKENAIAEAAALLAYSSRPVIYAGGGCCEAAKQIDLLSKKLSAPVATTLMGVGVLPAKNERLLGMLGMHGFPAANRAMYDADAVVAVGTRFDDRATGDIKRFCPNANIIHIDIDAAEINKLIKARITLVGDAAESLHDINSALDAAIRGANSPVAETARREWLRHITELHAAYMKQRDRERGGPGPFIASIPEAAERAGLDARDIIVTTDVGQHQMWTAQYYPITRPRQLLTSGSQGTMGFGLPAAIGAALANPDKRVVCISGDGSIMMNIQELATLAELRLNVTIIVLDNGALGMVRQQQEILFAKNYSASIFACAPDLLKIASAFGIASIEAGTRGWEEKAFAPGPRFVRYFVDQKENVYPFVPSGKANIDAILAKDK